MATEALVMTDNVFQSVIGYASLVVHCGCIMIGFLMVVASARRHVMMVTLCCDGATAIQSIDMHVVTLGVPCNFTRGAVSMKDVLYATGMMCAKSMLVATSYVTFA